MRRTWRIRGGKRWTLSPGGSQWVVANPWEPAFLCRVALSGPRGMDGIGPVYAR